MRRSIAEQIPGKGYFVMDFGESCMIMSGQKEPQPRPRFRSAAPVADAVKGNARKQTSGARSTTRWS